MASPLPAAPASVKWPLDCRYLLHFGPRSLGGGSSSVNHATCQCSIAWLHASTPILRFTPFRIASNRLASPRPASITASSCVITASVLAFHNAEHCIALLCSALLCSSPLPNSFGKATSIHRCLERVDLEHSSHSPLLGQNQQHRPFVITGVLQSKRPPHRSFCPSGPNLISPTKATAAFVSARPSPPPSQPLPPLSSRTKPRSLGAYIYIQAYRVVYARSGPTITMSRLSNMLAAWCVLLLASLVSAQSSSSSSSSSLFADSRCNSNLCLSVIYSPSQKMYNMTMSTDGGGAPNGWYAVGTGNKMKGSNMMIGWVDTTGKVVMSQRTASGHDDPVTTITAAAATMHTKQSFSNSSGTVWAWSFPLSSSDPTPGSSTSFIWAANKNNNPASSTSAHLKQHSDYGTFSLDLTKPYTASTSSSSSSASGSSSNGTPLTPSTGANNQATSTRVLNTSNKLIIAHMIMMILGWFILVPAGILVGRFGRTLFTWFPVHRGLQIAAFVVVLIAFILIIVEVGRGGDGHFESTHAKAGLAIFILMIVQIVLGAVGHKTKRFNPSRIVHVVLGLGVTGAAIWNSTEGLSLWDWGPPRWAKWILWIWAAVLAVAYLAGLALLPRDLRQWRQSQPGAEEKQTYTGLEPYNSGGAYDTPADSSQLHLSEQHALKQQHQQQPYQANAHPGWGAPPMQANNAQYGYEPYAQPQRF